MPRTAARAPRSSSWRPPPSTPIGTCQERWTACVSDKGQGGCYMRLGDVPSPGVHDFAALLQQVGAAVGGFDGVLDDVR